MFSARFPFITELRVNVNDSLSVKKEVTFLIYLRCAENVYLVLEGCTHVTSTKYYLTDKDEICIYVSIK